MQLDASTGKEKYINAHSITSKWKTVHPSSTLLRELFIVDITKQTTVIIEPIFHMIDSISP